MEHRLQLYFLVRSVLRWGYSRCHFRRKSNKTSRSRFESTWPDTSEGSANTSVLHRSALQTLTSRNKWKPRIHWAVCSLCTSWPRPSGLKKTPSSLTRKGFGRPKIRCLAPCWPGCFKSSAFGGFAGNKLADSSFLPSSMFYRSGFSSVANKSHSTSNGMLRASVAAPILV